MGLKVLLGDLVIKHGCSDLIEKDAVGDENQNNDQDHNNDEED